MGSYAIVQAGVISTKICNQRQPFMKENFITTFYAGS